VREDESGDSEDGEDDGRCCKDICVIGLGLEKKPTFF